MIDATKVKDASQPVYYVDANIFLNPMLYDINVVPEAVAAAQFLMEIKAGHLKAITSFLTWDEVTWIVRKNVDLPTARKKGREFLKFPNLKFLPVTASIINKAQLLLEQHPIKPRDAIHVASGLVHGVTAFVTLDDDFKGIPGITYLQP
nr:type II toxin-antitoxin system VapC family toxin [Candidatus Sigynarchaeota archaeon]